ncbi:MAG TPA: VIT domain-containing protein [Thermoanaerobaculia bacterium]|nr:VIT domain-containing protein [Thermoanaerobaculia bacterium]
MKRNVPILFLALLLTALLQLTAPAGVRAAGLLLADGGFGGVLEIQEHTVRTAINNGIAVTEVTQVFRNTEDRQVEALYAFPVPKGASVANFSMWINGTEMVGEVVEKKRAREIYDSYKQQRRDPGLLEQADFKTFEMRIFPIGPRAEQRVQITYYQELDFDHDQATYVYPLATVARPGLDSRARGTFGLDLEIRSEVPVTALESPSHGEDFVVVRHGAGHWQASLEATEGDLNRDLVLAFQLARPRTGFDLVTSRVPGEDGYFQLTLTAGEELAKKAQGADYVFVLDVSGSMDDDGKLALSRGSLGAFVEALEDGDRFEVITFNVAARELFGGLRPADTPNRRQASAFLASQEAKGGTFLEPALRAAYRRKDADRPLNLVILSDGLTEQGERQTLLRLLAERPAQTRVFAIGVGNDVNRPLLEQLAEEAGGLAAFISRGDDFGRQARAFRRKLQHPAASDLAITLEGIDAYDIEPTQLPDLFHGMPVRLYGRYRQAGPATVHLNANVGGEVLDRTTQIAFPEEDENPEIERMWAWHRVQRLLKEADREGDRSQVIDEIVRLGEGYSIVSEYTSFLVLENDQEYKRWQIERRNAARFARDRRKQAAVRAELDRLRSKAADQVGPEAIAKSARKDPAAAANPNGAPPQQMSQNLPASRPGDIDLEEAGGGGGGAFSPLAAGLAAALAGLALAGLRRTR